MISRISDTYAIRNAGKSVNDHLKESLETAIDAVGNLTLSGRDAVSSVFD